MYSVDLFRDKTVLSFSEILESEFSHEEKRENMRRTNYFIQMYLFGDAAVSFLAAGEDWWERHRPLLPYIKPSHFDVRTNLSEKDSKVIYFENGLTADPNVNDTRISYHMGTDVIRTIFKYTKEFEVLLRNGGTWDQVFLHTGSHKIIQRLQKLGNWTNDQLRICY